MKTIKLTENQLRIFNKLIREEDAPNFEGGEVKEYGDESETGNLTANLDDENGNKTLGSAKKQLGAFDRMAPQNWWANGMTGQRRLP
jgi:hypothetical protein